MFSLCVPLVPADVFAWLLLLGERRAGARMWVPQGHLNTTQTQLGFLASDQRASRFSE